MPEVVVAVVSVLREVVLAAAKPSKAAKIDVFIYFNCKSLVIIAIYTGYTGFRLVLGSGSREFINLRLPHWIQ